MGEVLAETAGIAKEFSSVRVLNNINLQIEVGPSVKTEFSTGLRNGSSR